MTEKNDVQIVTAENAEIPLPDLWRDTPVLLFFMRQLGCGLCRQQLLRLRDQVDRFKAANCAIAVIVMGDGKMAQGLQDLYNLPFPVYADPRMAAYQAFDIGETSYWNVIGPHIVARQIGTMLDGMKPGWGAGSLKQLGGLVLVNTDGSEIYRHVASPIYRYPPWDEVLAAAASARAAECSA
ncbi:MAG TPA: peroxiredoxin-like family protein [Herpetosiphonaceae bacterium]|nr:peroxiredoxin-like family protein [Herpetosiphonaceae bacterium]